MKRIALLCALVAVVGCGRGEPTAPAAPMTPPALAPSAPTAPVVVPPGAVDLATTALPALRGHWGKAFFLDCAPGRTGTVWGTDVYTDDSEPCLAAVHAGRLPAGGQGRIVGYVRAPLARYTGSARNGVTSEDYAEWPGAFQFTPPEPSSLPPEGHVALTWAQTATEKRGVAATFQVWCPPNGVAGTVWGTDVYTDDSSVCTAAVHAGVIQLATGGAFRVTIGGEQASFNGSTRNGVTTLDYAEYPGSFTVAAP